MEKWFPVCTNTGSQSVCSPLTFFHLYTDNDPVPSLASIFEEKKNSEDTLSIASTHLSLGAVAVFIREALSIQQMQYVLPVLLFYLNTDTLARRDIKRQNRVYATCPMDSLSDEIDAAWKKVDTRLSQWRKEQAVVMPSIADCVARLPNVNIEDVQLLLPSDFMPAEHKEHDLNSLAKEEGSLREGQVIDLVASLRRIVKKLDFARTRKKSEDRGQEANTRSTSAIKKIEADRDALISSYAAARMAMESLPSVDLSHFPELSLEDTFRKSTVAGRKVGASRVFDGEAPGASSSSITADPAIKLNSMCFIFNGD